MKSNTIGERIKLLRERKGITQAELAVALNVKRQTVDHWEQNIRDLKTQYTISIADYFNVTCDYVLRGVEAGNLNMHKTTGLSEDAINNLQKIKSNEVDELYKNKQLISIADMIIRHKRFVRLLDDLHRCMKRGSDHGYIFENINGFAYDLDRELQIEGNGAVSENVRKLLDTFHEFLDENSDIVYAFEDFLLSNLQFTFKAIYEDIAGIAKYNDDEDDGLTDKELEWELGY